MHNGRITSLDMLRGLAVVLMVFGHCLIWGRYGKIWTPYGIVSGALTAVRMPILFIISGLLAASLREKNWTVVGKRLVNLCWVYAIWVSVIVLLGAFLEPDDGVSTGIVRLAVEFVRPQTVMWFIWALALYSIILYVSREIPDAWIVAGAVGVSFAGYAIALPLFSYENFFRYAGFFFVGALYRDRVIECAMGPFSWRLAGISAGLLGLLHLAASPMEAALGWKVLAVPERFVICAIVLQAACVLPMLSISSLLCRLGRKTLPIYVGHLPILLLARTMIPPLGAATDILVPPMLTVVAVAGSLAVERIAVALGMSWFYARPRWINKGAARRVAGYLPIPAGLIAR